MSQVQHGLQCKSCGSTEASVVYVREEGPPACECGAPRSIWWGHGQPPGVWSDEKPTMDLGRQATPQLAELATTREGQKKLAKIVEKANPGKRVEFEAPSHARRVKHEEMRHEIAQKRKREGLDPKTAAEARTFKKAVYKETEDKMLKKTQNPAAATAIAKAAVKKAMT